MGCIPKISFASHFQTFIWGTVTVCAYFLFGTSHMTVTCSHSANQHTWSSSTAISHSLYKPASHSLDFSALSQRVCLMLSQPVLDLPLVFGPSSKTSSRPTSRAPSFALLALVCWLEHRQLGWQTAALLALMWISSSLVHQRCELATMLCLQENCLKVVKLSWLFVLSVTGTCINL